VISDVIRLEIKWYTSAPAWGWWY